MPRGCRHYEPDRALLLPPLLRDWLPEDHLAFHISDSIDALNLNAFHARYGDEGPEELSRQEDRPRTIQAARKRLEARQ